jgi:hypothetical protein
MKRPSCLMSHHLFLKTCFSIQVTIHLIHSILNSTSVLYMHSFNSYPSGPLLYSLYCSHTAILPGPLLYSLHCSHTAILPGPLLYSLYCTHHLLILSGPLLYSLYCTHPLLILSGPLLYDGWMPHNASFGFLDIAGATLGQIHF